MSDYPMSVREMDEKDIPAVLAIQNETHFENWDEKALKRLLGKSFTFAFVAEAPTAAGEWKVAGFAVFSCAADEAEILAIATAQEFLRKGVATEIFAEGESALADAGARQFYLEVRAGNANAIAFYRKLGFDQCGERKKYYSDGENAVLMSRPL
ncbi:MAG: GNAT family N-acetyltransferase [Hallerella porci]|uniref:[SSU ribosomal protein S18P]-alanine acetyltransferase n=1 Tax=Hallerella porci TaxID=1945871 RepID=A0ABX5LSP1_9BACT|nr:MULTISPECIES: GNAT family N-acetyltransferase [Hallerella]MCI5600818.1 GNAT family N-acetyltransferase [Hallerella sp.]MDY3921220.1 GNAT family N-acetyltransferase [Hallerella porci]PWL04071.1 [SSU ribosomal protein S18P]-alanine acetyltransferase [Hallerella porci]